MSITAALVGLDEHCRRKGRYEEIITGSWKKRKLDTWSKKNATHLLRLLQPPSGAVPDLEDVKLYF